jgi:hypothetical protein
MGGAAARAAPPDSGEIHGLRLGQQAGTMTTDGFGEFACGGNGGPSRGPIEDWTEFKKCRPEPGGLREVAVRFDDDEEFVSKAIDDPLYTRRRGTRVGGHPVLLSVLFDESGVARGIRFVSDPRGDGAERRMAHMLRFAVMEHYGMEGWACVDSPPAEGETPVGGVFIKQKCEKSDADRAISVQAQFLRRPGQADLDPVTRQYRPGQFDSWTRVEIMDPAFAK